MTGNFRRNWLLIALGCGLAVGAISAAESWSTPALYLAMLVLILVLCSVALFREQRRSDTQTSRASLRRKV
jgi:hypothetical protein